MKKPLNIVVVIILLMIFQLADAMTAYDFTFKDINGKLMPLKKYKGKVLLVVNTACKCGYTPQFKQLQDLYAHYKNDGFVVIGVPSDDFKQELQDPGDIVSFTKNEYHVSFPMTGINRVTSTNAHPFYKWAYSNLGEKAVPRWNFHKLLINRKGELVAAFDTQEEPMSLPIINAVHKAINSR